MTTEPVRRAVEVLVLGPVRVRLDGAEMTPGGRRERAVLAALALAGPAGLDHDRLVDQLWGPAPPATAHRTAQAYLSRLRSVLGADAVRTEAGRHRLAADRVDLWEFERLVQRAREDPARAPADLRAAVALWRDSEVAMDAALDGAADLLAATRRLRLDALETSLLHLDDAEVERGAEALLAEDPHRERAWAALATARYRLGRQGEALAAIREARHLLADELGVDLSPELEQLEQELLHHGLSADTARPLPTPLTALVGRDDLVEQVVGALRSSRLVTLVGTGGVGKTRVALAVAESCAAHEPAFFADLSPVSSAQAVDDVLVEAIDAAGEDVGAAFGRRFGRVGGLLVLDNCEHVLAAVAGRVAGLVRDVPRLRVLATSRAPLDLQGERVVDVPPLRMPPAGEADPHVPALRLFLDRAADVCDVSSWSSRDLFAAALVCRELDGLPLALEVAARRLRTLGVDELRAELAASTADALATALDASYEALPDAHRAAYARLGLLHGPVPLATAAAIAGDQEAVEVLLRASMLHRSPSGVGMYQPVRQHAASKLSPAGRAEGEARIAESVLALASAAAEHLVGPDELGWLARVDALHGDVRAVLEWAHRERPELVPRLAADVGYLWILGWSSREGRHWLDTALDQPADAATRVRLLVWSAVLGVRRGELARARDEADEAIDLARELGDPRLVATALHARAVCDKLGDGTARARALLHEAWLVRRDAGELPADLAAAAMSLGAIADIDVNEGRLEEAGERYAIGLPLMRRADTAHGLVAYLHSMSELALVDGDPARALELADEAQGLAVSTRDSWHLGLLASVRAAAARDLGRPAEEQHRLGRAALLAAADQPDPQVLLEVVEHVGGLLLDDGRPAEAARLLRAARQVREQLDIAPSALRRVRRDTDEAAAQSAGVALAAEVDLDWLLAAATSALDPSTITRRSPDHV